MAEHRGLPFAFPSGVEVTVAPNGATGGYSFVWDTGLLGAIWSCRQSTDELDWNFFVKPYATALLARGFQAVVQDVLQHLEQIGGSQAGHSINRMDYAIDIRDDDFELDLANFIAHPRTKRVPHLESRELFRPSAVFTGARLETVTVGKMPGRQVSIYDKTAEAYARQKLHFYEAWGIKHSDRKALVWRVELRLGKRELKERRRIRTIGDLDLHDRPALRDLLDHVRYVLPGQADRNVSRHRLHPIWIAATDHVDRADLLGGLGEIEPARIVEITEAVAIDRYRRNIVGNAAGLGAMLDLEDERIVEELPGIVSAVINEAISTESFQRSLDRARGRRSARFGSSCDH